MEYPLESRYIWEVPCYGDLFVYTPFDVGFYL